MLARGVKRQLSACVLAERADHELAAGIAVRAGHEAEASRLSHEVYGTPVGERRNKESGHPGECALVIEGRREHGAHLLENREAPANHVRVMVSHLG